MKIAISSSGKKDTREGKDSHLAAVSAEFYDPVHSSDFCHRQYNSV
jgi:hypothetical protein